MPLEILSAINECPVTDKFGLADLLMLSTLYFYNKIQGTVLAKLPKGHLIAVGILTTMLLLLSMLAPNKKPPQDISIALNNHAKSANTQNLTKTNGHFQLPDTDYFLTTATPADADIQQTPTEPNWKNLTVKSGDNLSSLFAKANLNDRDLYELFDENKNAKELRNIAPGQKMAFLVDHQGKLQQLKYFKNALDSLNFTRNNTGFSSQAINIKPEIRHSFRQGTINSSLYLAGKQADLPSHLTMALAEIFGFDIDFASDIQKGDDFKVMYEEQYVEGEKIGTGDILSAEFTNNGKTYSAVRYTNKDGVTRYFAPDGKGLNKAFLRMPIEFARITSSFSLGRLHPVLHTIRAHKGTDYGATTGTPIRSTGDGKVILAGSKGGFGNTIIIQHGQGYETLYGHLSKFAKGISTGSRVSQGQVIGYVGQTGLASGPHLHYEFHVNGQVRNPVTVALPQAIGVPVNEKDRFAATTQTLVAQLKELDRNSRVAMSEGKTKSN